MAENPFARADSHGFINIMIGIIGGIFGGISAILFISLLNYAQHLRELNPNWIFILPIGGILIRFLSLRFNKSILEAPAMVVSTFITHLGGGSAGREGAAIHFARILSENAGKKLKLQERRIHKFVVVSMGASFGATLGAPLAGFIFGFEYNKSPLARTKTLFQSAVALVIAQLIVHFSGVPHFHLHAFDTPDYELKTFTFILIAGIFFGFITAFFHLMRNSVEKSFSKVPPLLIGLIGGSLLCFLYYYFGLRDYQGLGGEMITRSSQEILSISIALKKIVITAITLGTGFQGGEYFPLAFIGSTFGSSFSFMNASLTPLLAALGFVATYGATTQTPIACTILACELFGWKILPFAIISLWMASRIHRRLTKPYLDPHFDP